MSDKEKVELALNRFWTKVDTAADRCWMWMGSKDGEGYGYFNIRYRGKYFYYFAHRLSYMLCKGRIPKGMSVCHKCDVRACVNPDHLFLGTQQDNIRDMDKKGRRARLPGSKNPNSKLSEEQVVDIRRLYSKRTTTFEKLGKRFGVTITTVWRIVHNKRYVSTE